MSKVDIGMIERRTKSLSSKYDKSDCRLYLERAIRSDVNNKTTRKNDINKFFSECMSPSNANAYYRECLGFIADEEDKLYSKILTESFVYRIMPYIKDMDLLESVLKQYKMSFNDYALIKESADGFKNCDRIVKNHNIIQEEVDLDSFVESSKNKSINRILPKICNTIYENTIDEQTPCQILSLSIDESSYLLQKHRVKYNASDMVKFITEYYLMKPNITNQDHYAFRNVLNDHPMLLKEDSSSVRYFTELYDASKSNLMHLLNRFIMSESKNVEEDFCYIIRSMPVGYMIAREDFLNNFGNILQFINDHMLTDDYDFNPILESLMTIPYSIKSQIDNETWNYNRDELGTVLYHYENAIEAIDIELASIPENANVTKKLISLKDCYKESINQLDEISSIVYTKANLDIMENMSVMVENSHAFYLNEFKVMRFATIVKTAMEIDKFIKTKGKKIMDKISGKIGLKKNKKNLKDTDIFETVTEAGNIDLCVCSFDIFDESNFWEVHDVLTELCKQLNENVLRLDETKAYYVVNSDTVEIRLEDSSTILLSDDDINEINETMSYEDKYRCLELEEMTSLFESIDIDTFSNITNIVESRISNLDYDTFYNILEASKFVGHITKDDVTNMSNLFMESHDYLSRNSIKWYLETWDKEESPLEIQIEACNLISALLESEDEKKEINKKKNEEKEKEDKKSLKDRIKEKSDKKKEEKDNKSEDDDKEKKNPNSGANLNTLKLYVKGLKAKMKDMSNKEKEWSRNIDMNFNRLYKSCKDALVSDRREAIIKGSIIPSFSKCIKIGITMAGLTFINPVAAAVTAVGGIAMSKNLTRKERLLLLDEITTELEVVEKEIEMAENSKNMKKYRRLLQYKKDLQRQYQRIKYNIRIGKDILPGSTTGMKDSKD